MRRYSIPTLALWAFGAALFGLAALHLLGPLGPIRSTATQLPGIVSAWFLGRKYAWLPTVSSMGMIPFVSSHVTSGPIPIAAYLLQLTLALGLVTAIGSLSDGKRILGVEVDQRREAERLLQELNGQLENRIEAARADLKEANSQLLAQSGTLEATVQDRTQELRSAVDDLEWLIAVIAHDLRAPIRHVRSYADLIEKAQVLAAHPDERHALERVIIRSRDLSEMIESLLKVGRSRFRELGTGRVNLRDLILKLAEEHDPQSIEIEDLPDCRGDEVLLREVFGNVLDNAYRHGRPPVRVFGEQVGSRVRISIEDSGPEDSDFRPGLGLMIIRRLADRVGAGFMVARSDRATTVATLELDAAEESAS
jgi:signal transduction histidine kinase